MKAEDMARLGRAERMMVQRILTNLGIEGVENKIRRARLRWFGHVERKKENDWVKKCTRMNVTRVMGRQRCSEENVEL